MWSLLSDREFISSHRQFFYRNLVIARNLQDHLLQICAIVSFLCALGFTFVHNSVVKLEGDFVPSDVL